MDPTSLDAYREDGGYRALHKALAMGPQAVIEEVTASKLVGRGGAAFPTGRKWAAVAGQPATPRYLVCNADESEPGTFKDRVILEHDPFALVESMTIAGFAVGASRGYLYLRGEYPLARTRLAAAIDQARRADLLGDDVAGSGWSYDIELRIGAGAYIAGEETALFESIEGGRPEPRNKPPFPVEVGLFGKPTAVNNVETLVNLPLVLHDGGAVYATHRHGGLDGAEAVLRLGPRRAARRLRDRVRVHAGRPDRAGGRRPGQPPDPGDPAGRRGGRVRGPRQRWARG